MLKNILVDFYGKDIFLFNLSVASWQELFETLTKVLVKNYEMELRQYEDTVDRIKADDDLPENEISDNDSYREYVLRLFLTVYVSFKQSVLPEYLFEIYARILSSKYPMYL